MSSKQSLGARARRETQEKRPLATLRDTLGLISAGAGIFAALFYLAGRSFAAGYFGAMNIPEFMLTFSIWEYGAVSWRPILLYPLGMMTLAGLFWGIVYVFRDWLSPALGRWLARFTNWLNKIINFKLLSWRLPEISPQTKRMFAAARFAFIILSFVLLVLLTLQFVQEYGALNGRLMVVENSAKVELVSTEPIGVEDAIVETSPIEQEGTHSYFYQGFRLLTVNNGKYYLFREIDPLTCKPLKVYVIYEKQNLQIRLLAAESLSGLCSNNGPDNLANSIPISPSTPTLGVK